MRRAETSLAADVAATLDRMEVPYVVVGATALAAHGFTRGTHDIDFLTTDPSVLKATWSEHLGGETTAEPRRGGAEDPLAGVVRFSRTGAMPVDLVVGRWEWQRDLIERSERRDLGVFTAPVPSAEDLVILKLEAGGPLDQRDAAQLIEIHGAGLVRAVELRVRELPEYLQVAWVAFSKAFGA